MIRTQKYAENAYPLVKAIKGTDVEAKYRTLALTFPTMIMQSGLAQAVGFLMAKNKPEHQKILEHITTLLNFQGDNATHNMHKKVRTASLTEYQLMTRQALEASAWLKRYTQSLLEKD